jgi:hypothetical protein
MPKKNCFLPDPPHFSLPSTFKEVVAKNGDIFMKNGPKIRKKLKIDTGTVPFSTSFYEKL